MVGLQNGMNTLIDRVGLKRRFVNVLATASLILGVSSAAFAEDSVRILALGDSLTAGYGLDQGLSVPDRLEAALQAAGHDVILINGGVSGDTTAGGRARLAWLLAEPVDCAIVALGGNDGLRGLPPEETKRNLDGILAQLEAAQIPALLAGMLAPPNLGPDYGREFDSIYPDLAKKHDVLLYPFYLEGVAAIPELNQEDGIHPNPAGVEVIVKNIMPTVIQLLEQCSKK